MCRQYLRSTWLPAVLVSATVAVLGCDSGGIADASVENASDAGRDAATTPSSAPLPDSLKGYELYAWDQDGGDGDGDGEIAYTLITGTNRQKTVAEVTARNPEVNDGAWVVISGQGLSSLERLLARVPSGTSVFLSELQGLPALSDQHRAAVATLLAD